jgi:hypothetical protein
MTQTSPSPISSGIPFFKEEIEAAPFTILDALDRKLEEAAVLVRKRTFRPIIGKGARPRTSLAQNSRFACP